uniref:U3 small nucleolar RNA-associated protein 18 homolog n=1 Tax=Romanomermis culicivorax TaxID=13658 RepID=A0A915I9U3_ROMCU
MQAAQSSTFGDRPKILGNDADELKALERAVFGGDEEFSQNLHDFVRAAPANDDDNDKDEGDDSASTSSEDEGPSEEAIKRVDSATKSSNAEKKAAWVDDDDESRFEFLPAFSSLDIPKNARKFAKITSFDADEIKDAKHYVQKLKSQYEKSIIAQPTWAKVSDDKTKKRRRRNYSDDEEDDSDDDLLKRTGDYIGKSINLPKDNLEFKRSCDVTASNKIKATVNTTEFHKQARVLLVSGYTQQIMLFQIDDDENSLLHSVKFDKFPIETAHFSADGESVIVGSPMHPHFYVYDMHGNKITKIDPIRNLNHQRMPSFVVSPDDRTIAFSGRNGSIHLLAAKTYDYIATLKMNGQVGTTCFSSTGENLYTHGDDGQVYVWDVNSRRCVHKFFDEGCIKGTSLAVSGDDRYIACGSNTGVVNLYDASDIGTETSPKPIKSIMNLTTPVTRLKFNGNGEILASSSNMRDNAVKMFHLASRSTYSNFPHEREKVNKVESLDFSPNNGYFVCGTNKGQALLYRLFHYDSY